jgi:glutaredoxin
VVEQHQQEKQARVTFYTKIGCHLCEDARELLDEIAASKPFDLTEIDIRSDMATYDLYRYRVPVILLNGTVIAEGRVEYVDLDAAIG